MALTKPNTPSCIKSPKLKPLFKYFLAMEITNLKFEVTSCLVAKAFVDGLTNNLANCLSSSADNILEKLKVDKKDLEASLFLSPLDEET